MKRPVKKSRKSVTKLRTEQKEKKANKSSYKLSDIKNLRRENIALQKALEKNTSELVSRKRELEIEAALDSVRNRALSMRESSELREVVTVLFQKLQELEFGIDKGAALVMTFSPDSKDHTQWITDAKQSYAIPFFIPFTDHSIARDQFNARRKKLSFLSKVYKQKEKNEYFKYLFKQTEYKHIPKDVQNLILKSKRFGISIAFEDHSAIAIPSTIGKLVSGKEITILKKFAKVFEQCYTRFLDLQKAETQAREAQIETSLERVRSRSMAMQKSEELKEVIQIVYDQLAQLKMHVEHTGFILDYKNTNDFNSWIADHLGSPSYITIPYFDALYYNQFNEAKKKGLDFFAVNLDLKEKNKFYRDLFKHLPDFPEASKEFIFQQSALTISTVLLDNVSLYIENFSGIPYSDKENAILMRFGKVFQQTYTRFLDLKKAEVQAREAKIEAALERVRSRTMGMQKSEDLREVVGILYTQLNELGFQWGAASITIMDPDTGDIDWWMEGFGDGYILPEKYHVPYFDHRGHIEQIAHWKSGTSYAVVEIAGQEKKSYDSYYFYQTDFVRAPENTKQLMMQQEAVLFSMAFMQYGALSWSPSPITDEQSKILQRFAKVFEQTYTRFLDLQKAEAQAREAQIEAALEKVRSSSLAMHQSNQLQEVVATLFGRLVDLGLAFNGALIWTFEREKRNIQIWVAANAVPKPVLVQLPYDADFKDNAIVKDFWEALESGKDTVNKTYNGKVKNEYFDYTAKYNDERVMPEELRKLMRELDWTVSFAAEKNSLIGFDSWSGQLTSSEEFQILKRFARVFEQAYTRFLDLQKAEAQAREAEIQLALERVRARTMAMQNSAELAEVSFLLNKQVVELGIPTRGCAFNIYGEKDSTEWFSNLEGTLPAYKTPREKIFLKYYEAGQRGKTLLIEEFDKKRIKQHYDYLHSLHLLGHDDDVVEKIRNAMPDSQIDHVAYFKYGYLLFITLAPAPDAHDIFKRFAKEFEQTYTRFLDLQKAEAQAREAQIEASLERVRSRTMGMQKSSELNEVAFVLFEQIRLLGGELWGTGFTLCDTQQGEDEFWFANEMGVMPPVSIPNTEDEVHTGMLQGWKENKSYLTFQKDGEALASHYDYLYSLPQMKAFFDPMLAAGFEFPKWQQWHAAYFSKGYLLIITTKPYPESEIFRRFANVFDQTYTRFLDLQKAEAQAREAQIQLALERVRARTMAMHRSEELGDAASIMFHQLKELGINLWAATFDIWKPGDTFVIEYAAGPDGKFIKPFKNPIDYENSFIAYALEEWKKGKELIELIYSGEQLKEGNKKLLSQPETREVFESILRAGHEFPDQQVNHLAVFSHGFLQFISTERNPGAHDVFIRMAKVFDQTYTRFLDLQKAEAQAREAQIEAALERVRSRTMGMQRSEELNDVAAILFNQINELGIKVWTTGFNVWSDDDNYYTDYITSPQGNIIKAYTIDTSASPVFADIKSVKKSGEEFWVQYLEGEELQETYRFLTNFGGERQYEKMLEDGYQFPSHQYDHFVFGSKVSLMFITYEPVPEAHDIFIRFGRVFQQTYTRFLDLQKAEAQAREAQIEAALERVRSRTMAMQRSHELAEAAQVLYHQFHSLGINTYTCAYMFIEEKDNLQRGWTVAPDGTLIPTFFDFPLTGDHILDQRFQSWKQKWPIHEAELHGEENKRHHEYLVSLQPREFAEQIVANLPERVYFYNANFSHGYLFIVNTKVLTSEEKNIMIRFARVFEQTYIRFLDLQKAEAQAREAQIEAALEKIRSRSLAMHHSDELSAVIGVTHKILGELNVRHDTIAFQVFDFDNQSSVFWPGNNLQEIAPKVVLPYDEGILKEDTCHRDLWLAMTTGEAIINRVYTKAQKDRWFEYVFANNDATVIVEPARKFILSWPSHTVCFFPEKYSGLFADSWDGSTYSEEEISVLKRVVKVFEQAYVRFLDLQKAEAQAREAQIEAALEKVRSRTLAMQKSDELAGTAAVLFQQLIALGIAPNRLFIILTEEDNPKMEAWLTDEDGSKVSMGFTGDYQKNQSLKKMYEGWKQLKKSLVIDMQGEELQSYFHYLHDELKVPFKGGLEQKRRIQHLAYFSHGMIGMASPEEQPAETLQLMERFASVFNLTFTRFNDLKIAEAHALQAEKDLIAIKEAKQKAEIALSELQATQKQLIQSEKMASLGELTAGIAHEIQNPLNFVNNFSEVSNELIDEMNVELEKGDINEALAIAKDVKQNLVKINHHGKRAGEIVKSMLQHSRSSTGQKELTDMNVLCDEYLRLAYHGLRAKDKSFNAKFETSLDPTLPKINVVPQDIGRVILNLINNAFYAVSEKLKVESKKSDSSFEPTVIVSTKHLGDKVEISVKDNGSGIPDAIKEKIFQPFFTTKPTGQGTGLGLSLSYDIVKAHGGELKVETKEGVGTEFKISLVV